MPRIIMNRHWKFGWGGAADNRILGNIYIYDAYMHYSQSLGYLAVSLNLDWILDRAALD
jgi:hypothetical protein